MANSNYRSTVDKYADSGAWRGPGADGLSGRAADLPGPMSPAEKRARAQSLEDYAYDVVSNWRDGTNAAIPNPSGGNRK
jgi:hypothetical protein